MHRLYLLIIILKIAWRALIRNPMRSLLTMLGIIIGIGAVIVMISIGRGASESIQKQISNLGPNMLIILSGSTTRSGVRTGFGGRLTLTVNDAEAIKRECPSVLYTSYTMRKVMQVIAGNQNWSTVVSGVSPDYLNVRDWPLAEGTFITDQHLKTAANVAVIGQTVMKNLSSSLGNSPVGSQIRIKNIPFKVIGVLGPKGQSPQGQDQDDVIIIPFTTAQRKVIGSHILNTVEAILVSAASREAVDPAKEEIEALLRQRHRIKEGQDDDFFIRSLADIAETAEKTSKVMTTLLASVASVSLIVGGIGIMNIMLVSVTERTREIGIRMAVGARERDILMQFLVEAMAMSLIGGLMGVVIGLVASEMIGSIAGWPILISIESILIASIFSGAVGIFFGYYPARKASRMNPIDALRFE